MLADAGQFMSSLENFNKDEITDEMINRLKPYIENSAFQPSKVRLTVNIMSDMNKKSNHEFEVSIFEALEEEEKIEKCIEIL